LSKRTSDSRFISSSSLILSKVMLSLMGSTFTILTGSFILEVSEV